MKQNIKDRTDRELYLLVYNTEELWNMRHSTNLYEELDKRFEYTEKQKEILDECLTAEREN